MKEALKTNEKVAAGGIVVDGQGRILLVHRPHYDDWSFPKGGVDKGETIEQAALREVKEEAGLECRIIRSLPDIHYFYKTHTGKKRPKVVHYFLMEIIGGQLFTDGKETDEAIWCSLAEAESRLSYQMDKNLLHEIV